jgi:hypothetical protein
MFRPQVVIRPDDDRFRSKHVAFTLNKYVVLDVCYFNGFKFSKNFVPQKFHNFVSMK